MLRNTVLATKEATFAVLLPNAGKQGMPSPIGTGFFVSPDGYFVTAAHVVTETGQSDGPIRHDISESWLMKEQRSVEDWGMRIYQTVSLEHVDSRTDFALLKVDYEANKNRDSLRGKNGFPFIEVSSRDLEEGEEVYSFGYPLSKAIARNLGNVTIGEWSLSPRLTTAIVSSLLEQTSMVWSPDDPKLYVLDKALNYGNSGGPIVAAETGKVHALCSRFQPVYVPQPHLPRNEQGQFQTIMTPSLYGVVSSLANTAIVEKLKERGVPISQS